MTPEVARAFVRAEQEAETTEMARRHERERFSLALQQRRELAEMSRRHIGVLDLVATASPAEESRQSATVA